MNEKTKLQARLHQAAKDGNLSEIRLLLKKGADPFLPDQAGKSAVFYVAHANPPDLKDFVKDLARFTYIYKREDTK